MAASREIINDLRAQARTLDGRYREGCLLIDTARSLRRGADEIERLLDELTYLRGYAEAQLDAERGSTEARP